MPLDVYSPCPAGTGKKIKFCCPDLVGELEKIERMLEGEQYQACLALVERLEEKHPGRACLLGTKCLLLRVAGRLDEAEATAAGFLKAHPNNPVALAETAIITAAKQGGRAALAWVQQAMAACAPEVPLRVHDMLVAVGQVLVLEGHFLAARPLLQRAMLLSQHEPMPLELLGRINAARDLPVWVKDERRLPDCPPDAPWRVEYEEIVTMARRGQPSAAEQRLLALAAQAGDPPAVWRGLAVVRGWLADRAGSIEALRKFAALDVPLEDAVEAEAIALFLSDDPLGDQTDVLSLTHEIGDGPRFQAAVASVPRMRPIGIDPSAFTEEDQTPPLAVYMVFDRPVPGAAADVSLPTVPRLVCQAMFFGKQTDREARLELHPVAADDLDVLRAVLAELGDAVGPLASQEVTERTSRTQELLARNWPLPRDMAPERIEALIAEHYDEALLNRWPALALGILDGQSPQEAAGNGQRRVRLLAAILLVEFWTEQAGGRFDFNRLRERLGLPTLGPLDPDQIDVRAVPAARLNRLQVEKLSDEALWAAFRRVLGLNVAVPMLKLGRAIVERPGLAGGKDRLEVCSLLARVESDSEQALKYVEEGRRAGEAAKQSSAPWDLLELSIRFARGDEDDVARLWRHIQTEHMREPGVAAEMSRFLVRIGAMHPDGTPVALPPEREGAEPGLVAQAGDEAGKLWVPGAEQGGEKPKLWMPGME